MRITKIKYNNDTITIEQSFEDFTNNKSFKLASKDEPLDTFVDALARLREPVIEICEFPKQYIDALKVLGVTFTYSDEYSKDNYSGAVITALRSLEYSNSPMVINTPWLPSYQFNESQENPQLWDTHLGCLNYLILEAERYLKGERNIAQLHLIEPESIEVAS